LAPCFPRSRAARAKPKHNPQSSYYSGTNRVDTEAEAGDERIDAWAGGYTYCSNSYCGECSGDGVYAGAGHCNTENYDCEHVYVNWYECSGNGCEYCSTCVYIYSGTSYECVDSDELPTQDESSCTQGSPPDPGWGTLFP
jgi:hypothetical protein